MADEMLWALEETESKHISREPRTRSICVVKTPRIQRNVPARCSASPLHLFASAVSGRL